MRLRGVACVVAGVSIGAWGAPAFADDWGLCRDAAVAPPVSIAACTRAINSGRYRNRDLSVLLYNRGVSHRQQGNDDGAMADYSEAIRLDPAYEKPFNNRGNIRRDRGDIDGALADYSAAIGINPDYGTALANRANVYDDRGELDLALADLDRAVGLDSGTARAYNLRGVVRTKKDEIDRAIADFDSAVRADPGYVFAYNNRGLSYEKKGELDRALADFRLALSIDAASRTAADGVTRLEQAIMRSGREPPSNVTAKAPVLGKP